MTPQRLPGKPKDRWIANIRRGDVLRERSGVLRIVRSVHHYGPAGPGLPPRCSVTLVIRRCSWTTRCYTVLTRSDIRARFSPTGKRIRIRGKLARQIDAAIGALEIHLTCCDVEGVS